MRTRDRQWAGGVWPALAVALALGAATAGACGAEPAFGFVDLRAAANRGFADEVAGDGRGGWFDQGPNNDLAGFPVGEHAYADIPFSMIDPEKNDGRSCVVLRGRDLDALPLDTGSVAVGRRAGAVFFLAACGWNAAVGETVASVTVRYRRPGLYLEIPVRYGLEVGGWWNPEEAARARVAWRGENASSAVGVYLFGWVNPNPDEEIESLVFASANGSAVPAFLAATLAHDPGTVAALRQRLAAADAAAAAENARDPGAPATVRMDFASAGSPVDDAVAALAVGFGTEPEYTRAARHLAAAGRHKPFSRLQINIVEPSPAEGVWDFAKLDARVDAIQAGGAEPMLCFGPGGPVWMADPDAPGTLRDAWRPRLVEEYLDYCAAILRRYAVERDAPVLWWQIGNETELKGWSYRQYVDLYRRLAPRLRAVRPDIKIGGPVTCHPNLGWARALLREAGDQVDFLSYHQYGYAEPFGTPSARVMEGTVRYRQSARAYADLAAGFGRDIPVVVTEANVNPRFARPEGTDPRIRAPFNAAWLFSTLCHFAAGGGKALCYFTLDGGFGATWFERGAFRLYPAYHALWLFRTVAGGRLADLETSDPMVEAYTFVDGERKAVVIVNKREQAVDIRPLWPSGPDGDFTEFVLNAATAADGAALAPDGRIPELEGRVRPGPDAAAPFAMAAYEVRVWRFRP